MSPCPACDPVCTCHDDAARRVRVDRGVVVSVARKLLAATGAAALSVLVLGAPPASAATVEPGGFADANGIILNLTVLTQVQVPGALGNTPLDPNTFASSSQSCPPN